MWSSNSLPFPGTQSSQPGFNVSSCCSIFSFLCNVLQTVQLLSRFFGHCVVCPSSIYPLVSSNVWPLCCLSFFDLPFGILKLFLQIEDIFPSTVYEHKLFENMDWHNRECPDGKSQTNSPVNTQFSIMVNVLSSSAVDRGFEPGRVKPRTIQLIFAASLLSMQL